MKFKYLLIILSIISLNFSMVFSISYNVCNVGLEEPFFFVNDTNGNTIYLVDKNGDVFIKGKKNLNPTFSNTYFFGSNFSFSNTYSKFNGISENLPSISNPTPGLIVKDSTNNIISTLDSSGIIKSKGFVVYEDNYNSQANCPNDGYYCKDSKNREYRNYYCTITGQVQGACKYVPSNNLNCGALGICGSGNCYSWKTSTYSSCSASPYWGGWSSCSASCGGGTMSRSCYNTGGSQSRSVWCEDQSGNTVSSSLCDASLRPSSSISCYSGCSGSSVSSCNTQSCFFNVNGNNNVCCPAGSTLQTFTGSGISITLNCKTIP